MDVAGKVGAQELLAALDEKKLTRFRTAIAQVESAGGRRLDHPELKRGTHKGTRAGGSLAVMPRSLRDFVRVGQELGVPMHPHIADLAAEDDDYITERLNNEPELDDKVGDFASRLFMQLAGGDDEKAAYMWNHGHNLNPARLTKKKLKGDEYTRRYSDFARRLSTLPPTAADLSPAAAAPADEPVAAEPAPDLSGPSRSGMDLVQGGAPTAPAHDTGPSLADRLAKMFDSSVLDRAAALASKFRAVQGYAADKERGI